MVIENHPPKTSPLFIQEYLIISNGWKITWNKVLHSLIFKFAEFTFFYLQAPCLTPHKEDGECTSIDKCQPLMKPFGDAKPSNLEYLNKFVCDKSPDLGLLVCCGISANFTIETEEYNEVLTPEEIESNNHEECGFQKSFENDFSITNKFSWVVSLRATNAISKTEETLCAGTLITSQYVITAANCISDQTLNNRTL